jgi:hypothetical protein
MDQTAVASPRAVVTHHLDHPELLLLDNAVARLAEQYIAKRTLTAAQRGALDEYLSDLNALALDLAGPAREYAIQAMALAGTILEADEASTVEIADGSGTHRAA